MHVLRECVRIERRTIASNGNLTTKRGCGVSNERTKIVTSAARSEAKADARPSRMERKCCCNTELSKYSLLVLVRRPSESVCITEAALTEREMAREIAGSV